MSALTGTAGAGGDGRRIPNASGRHAAEPAQAIGGIDSQSLVGGDLDEGAVAAMIRQLAQEESASRPAATMAAVPGLGKSPSSRLLTSAVGVAIGMVILLLLMWIIGALL